MLRCFHLSDRKKSLSIKFVWHVRLTIKVYTVFWQKRDMNARYYNYLLLDPTLVVCT